MRVQKITVEDKKLKSDPNMVDYKKFYKDFEWSQFEKKEMDFFEGGKFNAAYNAIERHANSALKNKVALYWISKDMEEKKFTFAELNALSNKFANLLVDLKVKRGERVFFFLPRVPEIYYAFLGCLKQGAIAGTLFSAFQEQALVDRLGNSDAAVVITNKELLPRIMKVKKDLPNLRDILVVEDMGKKMDKMSDEFKTRRLDVDTSAFMLYTSGTTGKPKGVIHRHGAILQEHMTAKYVLDIKPDDVYWCTADPGWVTGIAYEILGSWSLGAATVVYEGRFSPEVWYHILDNWQVSVWYTAPTAIRLLQAAGDELPKKFDLSKVRHACSVGEPLNPEPIRWGKRILGMVFHDTWFQTETGAIAIANYASMNVRIGSMGKPVPGVVAAIMDEKGKKSPKMMEGNLVLKKGWPSMMQKVWRRPKKYKSYFKKGWYITGDRAFEDKDGYFWFVGRDDDVIKTAGERVGPFEVESALVDHPAVVEAGVIGKPDEIRGQLIKGFIVLRPGVKETEALKKQIAQFVKKHLAGHAYPREIEVVDRLPKTRSGKIVRRILRAQEMGLEVGDTSTLVEA